MDGHTSVRCAANKWTAPYTFVYTFILRLFYKFKRLADKLKIPISCWHWRLLP